MRASVITAGDGFESILPSRIPLDTIGFTICNLMRLLLMFMNLILWMEISLRSLLRWYYSSCARISCHCIAGGLNFYPLLNCRSAVSLSSYRCIVHVLLLFVVFGKLAHSIIIVIMAESKFDLKLSQEGDAFQISEHQKNFEAVSIHSDQNRLESDDINIIASSDLDSFQMEVTTPKRFPSLRQEYAQQSNHQQKVEEKIMCLEDLCFCDNRLITDKSLHQNHKRIKLSQLLKQLQVLQCNFHFLMAEPEKVAYIEEDLVRIYNEICVFQQQINSLFSKVKLNVLTHINQARQSFHTEYFDKIKKELVSNFNYSHVKFALSEIKKYSMLSYPNLEYPKFKLSVLKNRVASYNLNNKVIGIQSVNTWIQRLLARDKFDKKKMFNRSIDSFMYKSTFEKKIFSYYLKTQDYLVTEMGRRLQRVDLNTGRDKVPVAVVEKQLLTQTEVKFKIVKMGKGIIIGFSPLKTLEANKFENCIKKGRNSYFLSNRGALMPFEQCNNLKCTAFPFAQNDVITVLRMNNRVYFKKKRLQKEQFFKIDLKLQEYDQSYYPCVHLEDQECIVDLIE